jgi:hypothetical protein
MCFAAQGRLQGRAAKLLLARWQSSHYGSRLTANTFISAPKVFIDVINWLYRLTYWCSYLYNEFIHSFTINNYTDSLFAVAFIIQ